MDSDLVDAIGKLKAVLDRRTISYVLGSGSKDTVDRVQQCLKLPPRYRSFLLESNPVELQTVTPIESVQFVSLQDLLKEQVGFSLNEDLSPRGPRLLGSWRRSWVVVAYGVLGDPYFLDVSQGDAEGDCPVYTAMTGTDRWDPRLAASSFVLFLQILTVAMELADGFGEADLGVDDEDMFREALGPRIRSLDSAALRAGHWT